MKQIPVLLVLGFALSFCNLSNKLKTSTNSSEPGKTGSNDSGKVERANPTAAQTEALAGGQTIKWDQQGMSWTAPAKWMEADKESKMLVWRSPGSSDAASLIASISPMDESFSTDVSIQAFYDGAKNSIQER